jgi:hypothetical protein
LSDNRFPIFEPGAQFGFDPRAVVAGCIESQSRSVLMDAGVLPPTFFDLSSGVAGELLHRLSVYRIRMAVVAAELTSRSEHFQDFVRETNRGNQVRFFPTRDDAVEWLATHND